MYTKKELKLNKFYRVHLETPKQLWSRIGPRVSTGQYSDGDEILRMQMSKVDAISAGQRANALALRDEQARNSTPKTVSAAPSETAVQAADKPAE